MSGGATALVFPSEETDRYDEVIDFILRTDWGRRYLYDQTKCYNPDQLQLPEICDDREEAHPV
jgi:hypothetical protein